MNQQMKSKLKLPSRISHFVFLFLFVFIPNFSNAQEVYDLQRCIQAGLERNFSLKVVRNNEQINKDNFTPGNAGMLPNISTTNTYGGTVNTTTQNFRDDEQVVSRNIHNTAGSAAVSLGLTIFDGFQVQNTYQKLEIISELGSLNTQMAVENLVARIVSEYSLYIQQLILYDNLAYAVSLSRERVRIDEQRYLLGGASKVELLQSLVYLNEDSSRYSQQLSVLRSSQIRLNELIAADDLGGNLTLKDTVIYINKNLSYDELLALTLKYNTSLQIASKNQVVSELDYKIIESQTYPYLNLTTGYRYNYFGYEIDDLKNSNSRGLNYGITLGMNIFDGFNQRREKSNARLTIENRNIQYKEVEQEVKADLLTIYYAYENNLRLLQLEEQNLEVARENLEIALERYKLGSLAGLELREVQKSLLDAEERLISVQYFTKIAEISLLQISGRILNYL